MSKHIAAWLCIFLIAASPALSQHSATISFAQPAQPSSETISSTCVYRNGVKQLPCIQPTSSPYTDTTVIGGLTYVYSMSNLDTAGIESALSASVGATIPPDVVPPPPPPPPPPQGQTFTFGQTTAGSNTDTSDSNNLNGSRYVSGSVGGTATMCSIFMGATLSSAPNNKGECLIYSDASGLPGTLITHSAQQTLVASARNDFPVSFTVAPNTAYWLMYNTNGLTSAANDLKYSTGGATGQFRWMNTPFGSYPAKFTTSGSDPLKASIFVTYVSGPVTPVVSVTITPTSKTLQIGQTVQFVAAVSGATDTSVSWSSSAPGGLFAAFTSGTFTVTATSNADSSKSASAVVTVAAPVLTWSCSGNTCSATGGVSGTRVGTTLNGPAGNIQGTVTLP